MLALLIMVVGTVLTLGLDQAFLLAWADSGRAFPIGRKATLPLPAGESLVWYESPYSVPVADVTLYVLDDAGDRVRPEMLATDISYDLMFGSKCGRALWKLRLPRAGVYEVTCDNHNFLSDDGIPPEDRVVLLKTPDSLAQANVVRSMIEFTGATVSITLVIVCYILHALTLRKRRAAGNSAKRAVFGSTDADT